MDLNQRIFKSFSADEDDAKSVKSTKSAAPLQRKRKLSAGSDSAVSDSRSLGSKYQGIQIDFVMHPI